MSRYTFSEHGNLRDICCAFGEDTAYPSAGPGRRRPYTMCRACGHIVWDGVRPQRVWILGAQDPEMDEIDAVLSAAREYVWYAASADGQRRCTPGEAYSVPHSTTDDDLIVIAVECAAPRSVSIDHHRPGDPGFGAPPAEYARASSLGQVLAVLGLEPTPAQRVIMAADHCLPAAYAGLCPGVDPNDVRRTRAAASAARRGVDIATIEADISAAVSILDSAPVIDIGGFGVRDLRGHPQIAELTDAACSRGYCYLISFVEAGRIKVALGGCGDGSPAGRAPAAAFLGGWGADQGLIGLYGDPVRGYAGGYAA